MRVSPFILGSENCQTQVERYITARFLTTAYSGDFWTMEKKRKVETPQYNHIHSSSMLDRLHVLSNIYVYHISECV